MIQIVRYLCSVCFIYASNLYLAFWILYTDWFGPVFVASRNSCSSRSLPLKTQKNLKKPNKNKRYFPRVDCTRIFLRMRIFFRWNTNGTLTNSTQKMNFILNAAIRSCSSEALQFCQMSNNVCKKEQKNSLIFACCCNFFFFLWCSMKLMNICGD